MGNFSLGKYLCPVFVQNGTSWLFSTPLAPGSGFLRDEGARRKSLTFPIFSDGKCFGGSIVFKGPSLTSGSNCILQSSFISLGCFFLFPFLRGMCMCVCVWGVLLNADSNSVLLGGFWASAHLTNSQVMPLLPVWGPHSEDHRSRPFLKVSSSSRC